MNCPVSRDTDEMNMTQREYGVVSETEEEKRQNGIFDKDDPVSYQLLTAKPRGL